MDTITMSDVTQQLDARMGRAARRGRAYLPFDCPSVTDRTGSGCRDATRRGRAHMSSEGNIPTRADALLTALSSCVSRPTSM